MAAEVCTLLWKNSGSFDPFAATLSFSVGLDCNWYTVVHQCEKLCKFFCDCISVVPHCIKKSSLLN